MDGAVPVVLWISKDGTVVGRSHPETLQNVEVALNFRFFKGGHLAGRSTAFYQEEPDVGRALDLVTIKENRYQEQLGTGKSLRAIFM